ncbi:MAG: DNA-3-methyladenine glycosylase I [Bradymonadales bacterium]|nr:DNA-3-methyladenine glycosylase I [Bradymonadales bacterium]
MNASGLIFEPDGKPRCFWCGGNAEMVAYHDNEWGRPVTDDRRLFEKLCLEGFQAGLSWLTILRKREAFRRAFCGFDFEVVARFTEQDVQRLLADASIVRHRGKIESAVNNAARACELVEECGSLAAFFLRFRPPEGSRPARITRQVLEQLTTSPVSKALAKELKRRGWTFVGPTTAYAFMQSVGLVNDHIDGCHVRSLVETQRAAMEAPTPGT